MRVLVISPFVPHPQAAHGGGFYLGQLIQGLRDLEDGPELRLLHYRHGGEGPALAGMRSVAVPRRRAAELGALSRLGQQLRFLWDWGLRGRPLEICKHDSGALRQVLRETLRDFGPDVVLVEFAVMSWCLEELAGVPVLLTDHECGASVPRRFGPGTLCVDRDRRLWQRWVARVYPRARQVQAVTAEDASELADRFGMSVVARPPAVAVPDQAVAVADSPPVLLFFGDYRHHPNPEAAQRVAREVLPRVRESRPDAEFWLVGNDSEGRLEGLRGLAGVKVLGFVEDLPALLAQARCMLAPAYSGSGIRTKSLLAMAHGLPLISNRLGVQGMGLGESAYLRGETAAELAAAALTLLEDPERAAELGRVARHTMQARFSPQQMAAQQWQLIQQLGR